MKRVYLISLLLIACSFILLGQEEPEKFTNDKGEVWYKYSDGTWVSKKNVDRSEELRLSGDDKWEKGDYDGAIADADKAISLNPKNYYAYNTRGIAKDDKGDYKGAIADYNRAVLINPKYGSAYYNRGIAKQNNGDYDDAIADYNKALGINPKNASAYNNRGNTKQSKGDYDGAIADYNKALEIDPNFEKAKNNLKNAQEKFAALKPKHPPTLWLISVGIGKYQQDYMLSDLEFTVPGAYEVAGMVERRNLSHERPVILHNSNAKRQTIINSLKKFTDYNNVGREDMVVFYFSGHGMLAGNKIGICAWDYSQPGDLITDQDIINILKDCPAKHKICFIEACKSETAMAENIEPTVLEGFKQQRKNISDGMAYITSTEVGKNSYGVNGKGGYFTEYLLEGLDKGFADSNSDKIVTVEEIYQYVRRKVSSRTNNSQIPEINVTGYDRNMPVMVLPK